VDNYRQALSIIAEEGAVQQLLDDLGVTDASTMEQWLKEEKVYLQSLSCEPPGDSLQIDYVQKLAELAKIQ
jgi:hypothetical protein